MKIDAEMTKRARQPLALISNDWHIDADDYQEVEEIIEQKIHHCMENGISKAIIAGDVFNSRKSQPEPNLTCLSRILQRFASEKIELYIIPGNHDKLGYEGDSSYLTAFKHHPGVTLFETPGVVSFGEVKIGFLPYYQGSTYVDKLAKVPECDVLISHQGMEGSKYLGKIMQSEIKPVMFKRFKLVLLGHFHNYHEINSHIIHMPSIQPRSFGEDSLKGFTTLYDDLTFEIIPSHTKKYTTIEVELNKDNMKEFIEQVKSSEMSPRDLVRLSITGDEEIIKSLPKDMLIRQGFFLKTTIKEIQSSAEITQEDISKHTEESIKEKFKIFCENNDYNYKQGIKYLL
jgi:DNA repair exonuclease SbcCD nuclease subunit